MRKKPFLLVISNVQDGPDDLRGIADDDRIVGDVPGDDAACADERVASNDTPGSRVTLAPILAPAHRRGPSSRSLADGLSG